MSLSRLLTAAAVSALLAGPAFAQVSPSTPPDQPPPAQTTSTPPLDAPPAEAMAPPTAEEAGMPASTSAVDPSAPAVILRDSPTPPDQAWKLKAGDPSVVTNGPVPDTAENRARYGQPMSHTGKRTKPAGN